MKTKNASVKIDNLTSFIKSKLPELDAIYKKYGAELVITSGNDSIHWGGKKAKDRPVGWQDFKEATVRLISLSKHYFDDGIDIRRWGIPKDKFPEFIADVRKLFPAGTYDVIVKKDHVHIEFDVKITEQNSKPRKPTFEMAAIKPEDIDMDVGGASIKVAFYHRNGFKRKLGLIGMLIGGILSVIPQTAILGKAIFAAGTATEVAGVGHAIVKAKKRSERTRVEICIEIGGLLLELFKKK